MLQVENTSSYRRQLLEDFYFNASNQHLVLQDLTKVNIYFKDPEVTVIEQQPMMMPFDLVSNVGGILGFFVGMSILSMCEVFEFFCELVTELFSKSSVKKNNKVELAKEDFQNEADIDKER